MRPSWREWDTSRRPSVQLLALLIEETDGANVIISYFSGLECGCDGLETWSHLTIVKQSSDAPGMAEQMVKRARVLINIATSSGHGPC